MPRRFRAGVLTGALASGSMIALAVGSCANPTQIIVDIRADKSLCDQDMNTGVAAQTKAQAADNDRTLETYQLDCRGPADRVGTLTITPSGDKDAELVVRVVAAFGGKKPERCGDKVKLEDGSERENWDNCILVRRAVQFAPGKTVTVMVRLTSECVGQYCGGDLECSSGECVKPEQVKPDGGIERDGDAPDREDGDGGDGEAPDACVGCKGACNGATKECNITCGGSTNCDDLVCGPGLNCKIRCPSPDSCSAATKCTGDSCTYECTGPGNAQPHCKSISCSAPICRVNCNEVTNTCDGVFLDGGANEVQCSTALGDGTPTCNNVKCAAEAPSSICKRGCANGAGCGPVDECAGNCATWEKADGGDAGQ